MKWKEKLSKWRAGKADDSEELIPIGNGNGDEEYHANTDGDAPINLENMFSDGEEENVSLTVNVAEENDAESNAESIFDGSDAVGPAPEVSDGGYGDAPLFASDDEINEFLKMSGVEAGTEGNAAEDPVYAYAGVQEETAAENELSASEGTEGEAEAVTDDIPEPDDLSSFDMNYDDLSTEIGSTDMNLRIAFGLDDEEEESSSNDVLKKFGDRLATNPRNTNKHIPGHYEFTDSSQARDIAAEFKKKRKSVNLRLILAAAVAVLLIVYENISVITGLFTGTAKQFAGILDPAAFPVVYIMVSLQLLLFTVALAFPEIVHGGRRLIRGVPTPESLSLVLVVAAVVSSALSAAGASIMSEPSVFNGAAAASVVMALIYSRLCIKRDMMAFFVAGSRKKKYAMSCVIDEEIASTAEDEDGEYYDVMKVERTDFIDGFFSRVEAPDRMATTFLSGILGISVAAAILFAVFAGRSGSASDIMQTVYVTLLCVLPLSSYLIFSYPFYRASSAAAEQDSAIIGEISVNEYSTASMITLDDSNVFPSFGVKVQNIRIYNNARIDRVLYYASSIFSKAGGPLADVFEVATMEMGRSEEVEILDADRGYLAATADGVNIAFGSYAALTARGFSISDEIAEDDVDFSDELSIMYMFREKVLISKMYIKYVLDGDIEATLANFKEYGMYICVRTYDPNIDEDMIVSKMNLKNPPLRVVKYRSEDEAASHSERADSGMVTFGSPKALVGLLPYCDQVTHTKRTCVALSIMSVIISLMLLAIFSMADKQDLVNSLFVSIYHAVWLIPTYLASKIFIR